MTPKQKLQLQEQVRKLQEKQQFSQTMTPDCFEPGMMEYPEQYNGSYNETTGALELIFDARGTRYSGRTERIENVKKGDPVQVVREPANPYNPNNFLLLTGEGLDVGSMPAELCNVLAPLADQGDLAIENAAVSYAEPLSRRSRHAKQAVLFVQMTGQIHEAPGSESSSVQE